MTENQKNPHHESPPASVPQEGTINYDKFDMEDGSFVWDDPETQKEWEAITKKEQEHTQQGGK